MEQRARDYSLLSQVTADHLTNAATLDPVYRYTHDNEFYPSTSTTRVDNHRLFDTDDPLDA